MMFFGNHAAVHFFVLYGVLSGAEMWGMRWLGRLTDYNDTNDEYHPA